MAGVTMPMCHNLIESIYCGSIPIIHESQNIGLVNGENCLIYKSLNELEDIIYNILDGDYEDIWTVMFNKVRNFYAENLEYSCFIKTIEKNDNYTLFVNAEQTSIRLFNSI